MLGQAFGLYSHMRNNRIRSGFLIAGLFLLVYVTVWGLLLVGYGYGGVPRGTTAYAQAGRTFWNWLPFTTLAAGAWVFIGFRINVGLIGAISGAKGLSREDNPKLYRMLENLCISRGLTVPKLAIVESEALNAFASGVNDKQFTVTVTSGLLAQLNDAEVEAVLAHELTHIRNGDVRLMIIAVVIAGVISLIGEIVFRGLSRSRMRMSSDDSKKGSGVAILIGFAVIALAWFLAVVIRLSLSRSREYLADAGAVELTKNPDAMISALLKIAGRADIEGVPSGVMDMCFENDPDDFADLFSTHPSVTKRVQALVQTAGGRMPAMPPHPPRVAERQDLQTMVAESAAGIEPSAADGWRQRQPLTASAAVPGPVQRFFQPVVAPEQLAILGDEGRRAEDADRLGVLDLRAQAALHVLPARGGKGDARIGPGLLEGGVQNRLLRDVAAFAEAGAEQRLREGRQPARLAPRQRQPCGDQGVLRKGLGPDQRKALAPGAALDVAPHVAPLAGKEREGRGRPALGGEDRAEQKGPPADADARGLRQRLDPQRGQKGIGGCELIPEVQNRTVRHSASGAGGSVWRRASGT
jgi:heat shock protein HtpX